MSAVEAVRPAPQGPDRAIEALGGTPPGLRRGPTPALRLPRPLRRRVAAFDRQVDTAFDHLRGRHPVIDRVFYVASDVGDFALVWHLLGALKATRSDRDAKAAVRLSVALGVESLLVNGLIKGMFRRTRPPWEVERPFQLRRPSTSSFPSGHASSGFLAATLLAEDDPAWAPVWLLAAVVAGSRIHVRIHHASDVVVGAALGLAMGRLVTRLAPLPADPAADAERNGSQRERVD